MSNKLTYFRNSCDPFFSFISKPEDQVPSSSTMQTFLDPEFDEKNQEFVPNNLFSPTDTNFTSPPYQSQFHNNNNFNTSNNNNNNNSNHNNTNNNNNNNMSITGPQVISIPTPVTIPTTSPTTKRSKTTTTTATATSTITPTKSTSASIATPTSPTTKSTTMPSPPHRLRTRNKVSYTEPANDTFENEFENTVDNNNDYNDTIDNENTDNYNNEVDMDFDNDGEEQSTDESFVTTTSKAAQPQPQKRRKMRKSNKSETVKAIALAAAQQAAKLTESRGNASKKRKIQTKHVDDEDLDPEEFARLEKNRQSARDCRLRKKQYILGLESKIEELEKALEESKTRESKLQAEIDRLKSKYALR